MIYSLDMEPHCSVHVYERRYTRQSRRYQRSSLTLTFPINAVPISGKFETGYFLPDSLEGTANIIEPPEQEESQWESLMLRGYQRTMPLQQVAEAIWTGDAIIGMDGSAANENGTYSFCHPN
jgi:hypothetical protein